MGYACLHEFRPGDLEAGTPVEPGRINLGVQAHARMTLYACLLHQGLQQQGAHAFAAPFLQYRHAPDVAVGQQATSPDRDAIGGIGERMVAARVLVVPFQFERYTLLAHEHELAYAAGFGPRLVPIAEADGKYLRWHGGYNTRLLLE